jgi:hypothetical protein
LDLCVGHGDPYYRTFDGHYLSIPRACSYILSQSKSRSNPFQIIANHELSSVFDSRVYIKSVRVNHNGNTYLVRGNILKVNGLPAQLPYRDDSIRVFRQNSNIVFDSVAFNVQYDGVHFIKVRQCARRVSGVCGNNNDNPYDDAVNVAKYLVNDYNRGCIRSA